VIADDLWVRNHFRPSERRSVRAARFVQHPPSDLRSLVRVRTRQHLGNLEYQRRFGDPAVPTARGWPYVRELLAPGNLTGAPVYVAVNAIAKRRAKRRWRDRALHWDADRTARVRSAS